MGIGTVHETWNSPTHAWVPANLVVEAFYTHRKSTLKIFRNSFRNVYLGGGGNTVGGLNPLWKPLLEISRNIGCNSFHDFEEFVKSGKVARGSDLHEWTRKALDFSASNWGTECRETSKFILFYNRSLIDEDIQKRLDNPLNLKQRL